MKETVYVLTNPLMPGIVKVGRTRDLRERLCALKSATGVPVGFEVALAVEVDETVQLERRLHGLLAPYRVNFGREFFRVPVGVVEWVLRKVGREFGFGVGGGALRA